MILDSLAKLIISKPSAFLFIHKINPNLFKFFDKIYRHLIVWAIDRVQNFDEKDITSFQTERLKTALVKAQEQIPYWRDVLQKINLNPEEIRDISCLSYLPVLKRTKIKESPDYYGNKNFYGFIALSTSGSTGIPFHFYTDFQGLRSKTQALYYLAKFAGMSAGLRVLRFSIRPERNPFYGIHWASLGIRDLNNEDERKNLYAYIESSQPELFFAWPTALEHIMKFFKKDGFKFKPKVIFTCSEYLSSESRNQFENFFGCEVFDVYGCAETVMIAQECKKKKGFHINQERVILEIVDNEYNNVPRGKSGKILVTFFDNQPTPFIRYDVGDFGYISKQPCPCGRKTPLLFFKGKNYGELKLPDGKKIPAITIIRFIDDKFDFIFKQYQLIQKEIDKIVVNMIPTKKYEEKYKPVFISSVSNFINCSARVDIELHKVDFIETLPSGKPRVFISKIKI